MIQCQKSNPQCRKKAVVYIMLKGLPGIGQEASLTACCAEHANQMLYGSKSSLSHAGITQEIALIHGWGVLTENYRVLLITDEMHRKPPFGGEA